MIRDSLQLRLLAAGAVSILAALMLAGAALSWIFDDHIERREAEALIRDGRLLAGELALDAQGRPFIASQPGDDRYDEAGSGLYWQLTTTGGSLHSPSLWDQSLPPAVNASGTDWRIGRVQSPFGGSLLIVERLIQPMAGADPVVVQVATDDAPVLAARNEFDRDLAISLGILWAFLLIAAYMQVSLGLRPLTLVRRQIEALQRSPSARLPSDHPREIAPLANAINMLADAREADLGRARKRAGDLAHSLKTPMAAISAQTRRAREAGATGAADGLERASAAMNAALEAELARTRAAAVREAGYGQAADIRSLVEGIIAVVERTEQGERVIFDVDVPDSFSIPISAEDGTELLGALIENAVRHARRRVRVSGSSGDDVQLLLVEDDGQGIGRGAAEAVLVRGGRLDEAGAGHGLGLAIASELMHATGGTIDLGRAAIGGLCVRLAWPVAGAEQVRERSVLRRFAAWLTPH